MRLEVAGHDRRRVGCVDQAPFWSLYGKRGVGACVCEDIFGEQHAQGEVAGRAGYGEGTVYVAADGVSGAGEVYPHGVPIHRNGSLYGDVFVRDAVALHTVLRRVLAVGEVADSLAGTFFGVGDHLLEGGEDGVFAAASYQLSDAFFCDVVGGDLGPQVAAPEVGGADVGEEEVHHVGDVLAAAHETHRRDDESLLIDLARV
jgi:hypothetical protein